MNRPFLNFRFSVIRLMAALVILAVTFAVVTRGVRSKVWPMYEAGANIYCRSFVHDDQAHASLEREARSDSVLEAALSNPAVRALPWFHEVANPRAELARRLRIEAHPVYQPTDRVLKRGLERVLIVIESHSELEAAVLTDAVASAFIETLGPTRFLNMSISARGSLVVDDSILDRPWKLAGALLLGFLASFLCLLMPTGNRSHSVE